MRPEEVWAGKTGKDRLVRGLLTPLSWLYAAGWQTYLSLYDHGFKKPSEPHRPVLCVGNLVVGGSGKSPLTLHLAEVLRGMGRSLVIGCSGYGAPHAEAAALAPGGPLSAAEWGDEPAMFRWLLPDVPLVVGRRRVLAAELAHDAYPGSVLLMDDGFQHLPLTKHVTILIDDPYPSNSMCLPAGPFREPRSNRNRASVIVPESYAVVEEPMKIVNAEGQAETPQEYAVLCALCQPERFLSSLASQYPNRRGNVRAVVLPDHDPLTAGNLWESLPEDLPVIVTGKDWVKLRERSDVNERRVLVALQEVHLEPAAHFEAWLEKSLDE